MNNFKWFLSIVAICLCSISCEKKCNINGIEISPLLISNAEEQRVNYCELVEKSFNNDAQAIKQLTLINFENSVGYEHGEVVVGLVSQIGEQQFLNALHGVNKSEKNKIASYLDVGLQYGNFNLNGQNVKEAFPKVYSFLNE
jgi:hypothetical protein